MSARVALVSDILLLILEISQEEASLYTQLTEALQKKSLRKVALMDFRKALRSGESRLFLSGKSYQWETYFVPLLMHVLECTTDEEVSLDIRKYYYPSELIIWCSTSCT